MKKFKIFLVCALLISCDSKNGTSTGDPIVNLKMNGSSQAATFASFNLWERVMQFFIPSAVAVPATIEDSGALPVVLAHFWTTLGEIEFELNEVADVDEVDGDEVEFEGPFTADILETDVSPLASAAIRQSTIRRIKAKLARTETLPAGAPGALLNQSVYVSGTVNSIAFSYSSEEETEFEVAGPNAIVATTGSTLLLQIQIANLFKRIDMSAIAAPTDISESNRVPSVNPCPDIDASASDLYTCFRKGLEQESNFGRDDGDNELEDDDSTVK